MTEFTVVEMAEAIMECFDSVLRVKTAPGSEHFRFDMDFRDYVKEVKTKKIIDLKDHDIQKLIIHEYLANHRIRIPDVPIGPILDGKDVDFYYSLPPTSVEEAKKLYHIGKFVGKVQKVMGKILALIPSNAESIFVWGPQIKCGTGWVEIELEDVRGGALGTKV